MLAISPFVHSLKSVQEGIFMVTLNDLEKFSPPNKALGHAEREEMADKVLDDTARAIKKFSAGYGIEGEVVTAYLPTSKPQAESTPPSVLRVVWIY